MIIISGASAKNCIFYYTGGSIMTVKKYKLIAQAKMQPISLDICPFGRSTAGNGVVATIFICLFFFPVFFSRFFFSVATFSHRRSARIKKLI